MEDAQPEGLLGLTIMVWLALVALVYVFLRLIGALPHGRGHHHHPPNRLQR